MEPQMTNTATTFDPQQFKLATREQWDQHAKGWDDKGPQIRAWLRDATDAMIEMAGIKPGMRVLDVAAGAGDQTLDIARRVGPQGSVLATDLSPAILEFAKENAERASFRNVRTQAEDGENLFRRRKQFRCGSMPARPDVVSKSRNRTAVYIPGAETGGARLHDGFLNAGEEPLRQYPGLDGAQTRWHAAARPLSPRRIAEPRQARVNRRLVSYSGIFRRGNDENNCSLRPTVGERLSGLCPIVGKSNQPNPEPCR